MLDGRLRRKGKNMGTTDVFIDLINKLSYKNRKPICPLTEITFFVGAGFSKSWDSSYPTGKELFEFKYDVFSDRVADFFKLLQPETDSIDISYIKNIMYFLEMQNTYPQLRTRYIDKQTISIALNEIKAHIVNHFNTKYKINYIQSTTDPNVHWPVKLTPKQIDIIKFFYALSTQATGDQLFPEGLKYHFISTNYDFIIETILSEVYQMYGDNEYFINYVYRGITSRTFCGQDNPCKVIDPFMLTSLYKINGGFEIYNRDNSISIDYSEKKISELIENPPVIILPNVQQNYQSEYFIELFSKSVRLLHDSKILVIIGLSFTDEDIMLRYLLQHFAEDAADFAKKHVFYIDLLPVNEQQIKIEKIFHTCPSTLKKLSLHYYCGKFVDFCKKTTPNFV